MVEFVSVTKEYDGGVTAVIDLNFKIEKGEFLFLIGPSGSGKTTVIKMLIRDETPTSGKVFFNDRDITRISRREVYKLRREIGVIFQDFKLVPEKTAYENVAFAMEAAGRSEKDIHDTVPYVLDIVGLSKRMDSFPRQLSGGEQQRVAIARAMANNPKILIADEPTGNLDPASAWDIVQILTKVNNWGTTVIMSTHGTDIVNSLNKRVIQMDGGKIIRDDNKGQYEMARSFEERVVEGINLELPEKRKNKFEFTLKEEITTKKEIKTEKKRSFFSFFKRNKKNEVEEIAETDYQSNFSENILEALDQIEPDKEKILLQEPEKSSNEEPGKTNLDNLKDHENVKAIEIEELGFPKKIVKSLHNDKIFTLQELVELGIDNFKEKYRIKEKDLKQIRDTIENYLSNL